MRERNDDGTPVDDRLPRILDMVGDSLGVDMSGLHDCVEDPDPELTLDDLLGALIDDLSQERQALCDE